MILALWTSSCREDAVTAEPEPDCVRDVDCGAAQTCRNGQCVASSEQVLELTERPQPPAWAFRGGPGQWGLLVGAVPTEAPELLWEQQLGGPISAAPVIAEVGTEQWAVVGTHHGRLVGAVVHGKEPGDLGLDVWLPGILWGTVVIADGVAFVGADDDHLHAVELATGADRFHLRIGDCEPPRAPGPVGTLCDVDGGPTLVPGQGGGDLYFGADGVYRVSTAGQLRWHTELISTPSEPKPKSTSKKSTSKRSSKKKSSKKKSGKKKSKARVQDTDTNQNADTQTPQVDFLRRTHVDAAPLVTPTGDVFVGTQGVGLVALAPDGHERWRVELRGDVDGAPVLTEDGLLVVGDDGGQVTAFDPAGNQRWQIKTGGPIPSALALGSSGEIIVANTAGQVLAIGPGGKRRFTLELEIPITSSPRVDAAGTVLVVSEDGMLHAISPRGKIMWQVQLSSRVDGAVTLSPGGVLLAAGVDGVLAAYGAP